MKKLKRFLRSFRVRVLMSFVTLKLILLVWVVAYIHIDARQNSLASLSKSFDTLEQAFIASNVGFQSFLLSGYREDDFHLTGFSKGIDDYIAQQDLQTDSLRQMIYAFEDNDLSGENNLCTLIVMNQNLKKSLMTLKDLYLKRGYVDYGAEGDMRLVAHALEDSTSLAKEQILQLRRHEKDYLLRGKMEYVEAFNFLINKLKNNVPLSSKAKNDLQSYQRMFNHFVGVETALGAHQNTGAYNDVRVQIDSITRAQKMLKEMVESQIEAMSADFKRMLWQVSLVAVVLALVLSIYFSSMLTQDIRVLNSRVFAFKKSMFKTVPPAIDDARSLEVGYLNKNLDGMMKELSFTLKSLKVDKVRAEEMSKQKTLFLTNMSHEIRTPLNGITGMLHVLKSTNLTDEQLEQIEIMDYSANHLMELVNMILDQSKINAGQMKVEKVEFDLDGDIKKLKKIFEHKCGEKGLSINVELKGDTTHKLVGDPLRLQQVLINLVNNGIKFTDYGGIEIKISEESNDGKHQVLKFEVRDTGIGIEQDQLARIFEAFEQSDSSITRKYGGTGLGLAISSDLVKLMGGELRATSEEGKGSVFFFTLKFELGAEKKIYAPSLTKTEALRNEVQTPKILLAEDNIVNQKVLTLMITQMGIEVVLADNGEEAVSKFMEEDFDIVLMDLQMPKMDGLEAMRCIKQSHQYISKPVPVVAVTANAFSEDRMRALQAGMDDYLSKPVKPADLKGLLVKYLQSSTLVV
ncbi:ATP-binding protein [Owenweeksia hongkongensis]|uniref:ATP-binding protein n=1 Tax=Owenweeksia hongkongensis TaxID=253245 RepID=UPI003A9523D3